MSRQVRSDHVALHARGATLAFGQSVVLDAVDLTVASGWRVGLVGYGVVHDEFGRRQARVDAPDRVSVALATDQADDLDVGVTRQQPDQLAAGVAGRADHGDADRGAALERPDATLGGGGHGGQGGGRRTVRRDRRTRRVRAHRRAGPLAGGRPGVEEIGRIVVTE